ncbi:MAG: tyrosine-type recombinase/integrase [Enterocloster sp.]
MFPHLLRHTFATRALNKGMPLPALCDLMGHASISQKLRGFMPKTAVRK